MKRVAIILGILTMLSIESYGQQDPQYTQYMYNMNIVNPAYAGSRETLNIGFLYRTQWVGLDGSPETFVTSIDAPIRENMGVGLSFFADKIGPVKEQNVYVDFSYTIETSSTGKLAFGVKAGVTFLDALLTSLDLGDDIPDELFDEDINDAYPNIGAGAYYYTNNFYASFSIPNMLNQIHLEKEGGVVSAAAEKMHYFFSTGYVFDVNENLKLKPSTFIKGTTGAPVSIDIAANALIYNKLEFGVSWRIDDSVNGIVMFEVAPLLRIGYAYDYTTTNLGDFNSGSHEIMLLFTISNSRDGLSPRFF
jgi:type IX secretion system PorP/SprF family membrane protein